MSDIIQIVILHVRGYVIIELSRNRPSPPSTGAASNGGTSSTPVTAPVDSPALRQPPPEYDPEVARQLDVMTDVARQYYEVDPSESRN